MRRFQSCVKINSAFRFSSTSSIIDNKSLSAQNDDDAQTLDRKLKDALRMRKKLCGLPNKFTTYFRAVDGINDGVQINNENIVVDVLASTAQNKIKDYFIVLPRSENEEFRNLVTNAFKEEGYADFWQEHNNRNRDDDTEELLFFRELTIFYSFRKQFLLDGTYSIVMRGRLARQVFFFDVLGAAEIEQDEDWKNTKSILCFNAGPHSCSMLAHLANASENVDTVFVVESNSEMISQGNELAKLQIEMQTEDEEQQQQKTENSNDDSRLQFMDLGKYFEQSSSLNDFDAVSIELQVPENSPNENAAVDEAHKKILQHAMQKISNRSPRKIFILAYNKNGDTVSSTSAEQYGLKLIQSCRNFLVVNNFKESPNIIMTKDDGNNNVVDQERTIEAFLRDDEKGATVGRIKERAKMGTGGYRLRVVKKVGQGPEFPVNVMSKSCPIEECYRHICAFVVEVW